MKKFQKFLRNILLLLLGGYVFICGLLYFFQEKLIFFPSKTLLEAPNDLRLEDVFFTTSDNVVLHARFMDVGSEKTVLFFHGNAGNVSLWNDQFYLFQKLGYNALTVDYRGYGKSESSIKKEEDIYTDALAAYTYLREEKKIPEKNIIFWGRSLGNAPSLELAQNKNLHAVVVESAFTSLEDVSREHYSFFPTLILLQYSFKNDEKIQNISAPVLVIHSRDDKTIPFSHGEKLFLLLDKNTPEKKFIEISGDHNNGWKTSWNIYFTGIQEFFAHIQ
jgi:fermentation-respiration switch protein FrsA (DUF1100 family)